MTINKEFKITIYNSTKTFLNPMQTNGNIFFNSCKGLIGGVIQR